MVIDLVAFFLLRCRYRSVEASRSAKGTERQSRGVSLRNWWKLVLGSAQARRRKHEQKKKGFLDPIAHLGCFTDPPVWTGALWNPYQDLNKGFLGIAYIGIPRDSLGIPTDS